MAKLTDQRQVLEEYLRWDRIEKDAKNRKDALKEKVHSILAAAPQPDLMERRKTTKTIFDSELAKEWAEQNLTPENYKKLFTRVFDQNKWEEMRKKLKIQDKALPKGTYTQTESFALYPVKKQ